MQPTDTSRTSDDPPTDNYTVVMSTPRSIRFESSTEAHLAAFAARRAGLSQSGAAALLVEEGLRMDTHPGVIFRDGPAGRRATIIAGPDVWEVIRSIKDVRDTDASATGEEALAVVQDSTGLSRRIMDIAVGYYADYPDEVDALIAEAESVEAGLEQALERRRSLLGA